MAPGTLVKYSTKIPKIKIQSYFTTSLGIIPILKHFTVLEHGIIFICIFPFSVSLRLEMLTNTPWTLFPHENWGAMRLRLVFLGLSSRGGSWICLSPRSRTALCPPWSAVVGHFPHPGAPKSQSLREVTAISLTVFPQMTKYFLLFERNTKEESELLPLGPKSGILPRTNNRSLVC